MEKVAEFGLKYSTRYSATYLVQRYALYISEIPLETFWSGVRSITQMAVFRCYAKNRVRSLLKPYTTFAIVIRVFINCNTNILITISREISNILIKPL